MSDDRELPAPTPADLADSATVDVRGDAPTEVGPSADTLPLTTGALPALHPGQRLGNRYVVHEQLGRGGMGVVYRATDDKLHAEVALKVVHDAYRVSARLREEVRLAQKVTHPNVCRTYDLEDVDGYHLVKMEYVAGETLGALLQREGRLPVERTLVIARAIASGLAAAHAQGIAHRDLKPQNVMIAGDRVVLMDFGLAQRIEDDDGAIVGTPAYMAPEQVAGAPVDDRSDLYALGCVVFELLTGEHVFAATHVDGVMAQHQHAPPRALAAAVPGVPRWLARAVDLLLAKAPGDRPGGLALLLAGPPVRARGPVIASGLAAAAIATALTVSTLRQHGESAAPRWAPAIVALEPQFAEDGYAALSPDGAWLAYSSDRETPGAGHRVFLAPTRGRDPGRALTPREVDANRPRWTHDGRSVLYHARGVLYRQPVGGDAAAEPLGPSDGADDCGDAIVILRFAFAGSYLELRAPDGTRARLATLPGLPTYQQTSVPRCSPSGDRVLVTSGASSPSACIGDVWIIDRAGTARQLTRDHRTCKAVFTADGTAIVVSARRDGTTLLHELPLDGRPERPLTTGTGPDGNPDVSASGELLVFQREVLTSKLQIGDGSTRSVIPVKVGVVDTVTSTRDFSHVIAQRDDPAGGSVIEAIRVADGRGQVLAEGILPFASFDGRRVLFRTIDRPRELRAVPIEGGPAEVLATLAGTIALGGAGPDGAHVLIEREGRLEGWRVGLDGAITPDDAPGLVLPAPVGGEGGGWRMVQIPSAGATSRLLLVPPGAPLSAPAREVSVASIYNAWIDDHRIAVARDDQFQIIDVTTGAVTVVATHPHVWPVSMLAADGVHWATVDRARSVARHAITNFADRPRP